MKTWKIALVVAGAMALVVGVAKFLAAQGNDPHPSQLPAWIEAIATLAAFGAAAAAALLVSRTVSIELQRESDRLEVARSSQAVLVAAWIGPVSFVRGKQNEDTGLEPGLYLRSVDVVVRNASQVPVSDVELHVIVLIGRNRYRYDVSEEVGTLEPETTTQIPVDFDMRPPAEGAEDLELLEVNIHFRDAAGIVWERDRMGLHML